MAEGMREVLEELTVHGIDLLGQQADVVDEVVSSTIVRSRYRRVTCVASVASSDRSPASSPEQTAEDRGAVKAGEAANRSTYQRSCVGPKGGRSRLSVSYSLGSFAYLREINFRQFPSSIESRPL
jgi:hypothetical protein